MSHQFPLASKGDSLKLIFNFSQIPKGIPLVFSLIPFRFTRGFPETSLQILLETQGGLRLDFYLACLRFLFNFPQIPKGIPLDFSSISLRFVFNLTQIPKGIPFDVFNFSQIPEGIPLGFKRNPLQFHLNLKKGCPRNCQWNFFRLPRDSPYILNGRSFNFLQISQDLKGDSLICFEFL